MCCAYSTNTALSEAIQQALFKYKLIMFEGQNVEITDVNISMPIRISSNEDNENHPNESIFKKPCIGKCFCGFTFWHKVNGGRIQKRCGNIGIWFTITHYDTKKQTFKVQIDNKQILLNNQDSY